MKRLFIVAICIGVVINLLWAKDYSPLCKMEERKVRRGNGNIPYFREVCFNAAKESLEEKNYLFASAGYLISGHFDKVIALKDKTRETDMLSIVGHAYLIKGDIRSAIETYCRYLKRDVDNGFSGLDMELNELKKIYPTYKDRVNEMLLWVDAMQYFLK